MKDDKALTAATAAAFLSSFSKTLNQWSMPAALAALLISGLGQGNIFMVFSLLTALFQAYFAARCAFDAAVFAALGGEPEHYESFDQILMRWRLRSASIATTRPLNERVKGAMHLLRLQAVSFLVQIILLAVGLIG